MSWLPGQFMHYRLPHNNPDEKGTERDFTISSAPYEKHLTITTRVTGSSFKNKLMSLKSGDEIEAEGPKGKFIIENASGFHLFIGGGIGVTPFRSIFLQNQKEKKQIKGTFLYANRDHKIVFQNLFDQVSRNIGLKVDYLIHPKVIKADTILESVPNMTKPQIYLSGPEPMVEYYEKMLLNLGFDDSQIKRDYFPGYDWLI